MNIFDYDIPDPNYDIVYKVVRKNMKDYTSVVLERDEGGLIYTPGKWVSTREPFLSLGYYICVFDSIQNAYTFRNSSLLYSIWECKWRGELKVSLPRPFSVVRFIRHGTHLEEDPIWVEWPTGTLMAKEIKMVRQVWQ